MSGIPRISSHFTSRDSIPSETIVSEREFQTFLTSSEGRKRFTELFREQASLTHSNGKPVEESVKTNLAIDRLRQELQKQAEEREAIFPQDTSTQDVFPSTDFLTSTQTSLPQPSIFSSASFMPVPSTPTIPFTPISPTIFSPSSPSIPTIPISSSESTPSSGSTDSIILSLQNITKNIFLATPTMYFGSPVVIAQAAIQEYIKQSNSSITLPLNDTDPLLDAARKVFPTVSRSQCSKFIIDALIKKYYPKDSGPTSSGSSRKRKQKKQGPHAKKIKSSIPTTSSSSPATALPFASFHLPSFGATNPFWSNPPAQTAPSSVSILSQDPTQASQTSSPLSKSFGPKASLPISPKEYAQAKKNDQQIDKLSTDALTRLSSILAERDVCLKTLDSTSHKNTNQIKAATQKLPKINKQLKMLQPLIASIAKANAHIAEMLTMQALKSARNPLEANITEVTLQQAEGYNQTAKKFLSKLGKTDERLAQFVSDAETSPQQKSISSSIIPPTIVPSSIPTTPSVPSSTFTTPSPLFSSLLFKPC